MYRSNQTEAPEAELEQYIPVLSEEAVTEFLVYTSSIGAPKIGLFEEVINYFLVY